MQTPSHKREGSRSEPPFQLDTSNIVKAFQIIGNGQDRILIEQADQYLFDCEANPRLAIALIQIFGRLPDSRSQWQILVHLKTVLRRNWSTKRRHHERVRLGEDVKEEVKAKLIVLYEGYWKVFYKQFNDIFRVIAKDDYPSKYPALKQMITSMLSFLSSQSLEQLLPSDQLLPYLSLVKGIFKEITHGRLLFSSTVFVDYMVEPIQLTKVIQEKLNSALVGLGESRLNEEAGQKLLECSRKVDKIILYSLTTISSDMQRLPEITSLLELHVDKITFLAETNVPGSLMSLVQKNLAALIQGLTKIQGLFPFSFTGFLRKYLETTIRLLLNCQFQDDILVKAIIQANSKPLTTVAYYMGKEEYANSMYGKKNKNCYAEEQAYCNQIFAQLYGGENPCVFLQKILNQLLPAHSRKQEEDQLIFEDTETIPEVCAEKSSFDLLLILFKNIVARFVETTKPFLFGLAAHLCSSNSPISGDRARELQLQVLMLLPRTLEENQINITAILDLMHKVYNLRDFKSFCRIVRHYDSYLTPEPLAHAFSTLVEIIRQPGVDHFIIYQCTVCLKTILGNNEERDLPMERLGDCISSIFRLLSIYKDNPNHLWNLLNLLAQITRCLSTESLALSLPVILNSTQELIEMRGSQGLIIGGIAEMLEGIIETLDLAKVNPSLLSHTFQIAAKHLAYNLAQPPRDTLEEQDNLGSLFRLWLALARNYYPKDTLAGEKLKYLMSEHNLRVKQCDPIRFLELTEEYLINGLVQFNPGDISTIFQELLQNQGHQLIDKVTLALFSLYYTYALVTNSYIEEILVHALRTLKGLASKISSSSNSQRSFIYMIVCHHMVAFGPDAILRVLGAGWPDYKDWFWPLVWSLDYLNQKYASKVVAMGLLACLPHLPADMLRTPISNQIPLNCIIKFLLAHPHSIKEQQAVNSYMNALRIALQHEETGSLKIKLRYLLVNRAVPKKYKLHVNGEWANIDLAPHLRQKMRQLREAWGQQFTEIADKLDGLSRERLRDLLDSN